MKNIFSAVGCKKMEGEKTKMERLEEEAKQEGSKSGKKELEGERGRAEKKKISVELLLGRVVGERGSAPKVESVGTSFETSLCVPDVLLSVNVVTVPSLLRGWAS